MARKPSVSLGVTPARFLEFVEECYDDHVRNPLSLRHAIALAMFADALSEQVYFTYKESNPDRIYNLNTKDHYRACLEKRCEAVRVMRDICEVGKHINVGRGTIVRTIDFKEALVPVTFDGFSLFGQMKMTKLIVAVNKEDHLFEVIAQQALKFWRAEFQVKGL